MISGLMLEGGAMRGIYSAGVMDAMLQDGIEFDYIVGVSAGALFGCNYPSKQIGRVLRYNLKYCDNPDYMGLKSFLTTGNVMNEEFCFKKLVYELDPFDFDTFKQSKTKFYCVVTNCNTGKAEYKLLDDVDHKQLEYLRASGSMPLLSKEVMIDGIPYLDGGIACSIPLDYMLELPLQKRIIILTRPLDYRKKPSKFWNVLSKLNPKSKVFQLMKNRHQVYNETLERIIELERKGEIIVIRPSKTITISRLEKDRTKIQAMYDLGVSDYQRVRERIKV